MMKSGLRKIFLKFLHALTMSFLLLNFDQKYKFSNKNNIIFHNAFVILCILFEKFGGDPMKRTINNQLQAQICYAFLLNNVFHTPLHIWRIFVGSI